MSHRQQFVFGGAFSHAPARIASAPAAPAAASRAVFAPPVASAAVRAAVVVATVAIFSVTSAVAVATSLALQAPADTGTAVTCFIVTANDDSIG
jgi:hypothetical protein